MSLETWGLRVPEACKAHLAQRGNLEDGVALGAMELEACRDKQAPRVTEVSMAWLGCQGRRATGVTLVLLALREPQEMMERGVTMEKSGPGVCPESPGRVVCLDQRGLLAPQDLPV